MGILTALHLPVQDGKLPDEAVVLPAQLIGGAGQLLHLGLIFLGDFPNVGDHILSVKAAEHPRSEICAHSILRYTRGICRNAAENRISFSSTIAQTWLYDKREML